MKKIVAFLLFFLAFLICALVLSLMDALPVWLQGQKLAYHCVVFGGLGGCVYCLRAVYLNACVRKQWDDGWQPWYYIRPFVSLVCGGISCLFLKAGLLVLESGQQTGSSDFGFLALAFIAGLNVDKFTTKIEDIAQAVWGIEKSREGRNEPREPK